MQEELKMNAGDDLEAFARRLSTVAPAAPGVAREELLFAAGRAAGSRGEARWRRQLRLWQGVCGLMVMVGVGLVAIRPGGLPQATRDDRGGRQAVQPAQGVPSMTPGVMPPPANAWMPLVSTGTGLGMGDQGHSYLQIRRQAEVVGVSTMLLLNGGGPSAGPLMPKSAGPALRRSEGLDAVPAWQRETVSGGDRS